MLSLDSSQYPLSLSKDVKNDIYDGVWVASLASKKITSN